MLLLRGGDGGGGQSATRDWYPVFSGQGSVEISGSHENAAITLAPAAARTRKDTHAALVVSKRWYYNFAATARVTTDGQLRHRVAGQPRPWEVGWFVWHYTSTRRFYALTLEPNGWLLSKQDPGYPGGERFLASGPEPRFAIDAPHSVGVVQIGNRLTISADGHLLSRFVDTEHPYLSGALGAYAEDSVAHFSAIKFYALSNREAASSTLRCSAGKRKGAACARF